MKGIAVENLTVKLGGVTAVSNLSFSVAPGEIFGIIGPNGAGKTTTFNLLSRLYTPTSGVIRLGEIDITTKEAHQVAELGLARTFQNIELFEKATVLQNLLVGRHSATNGNFWSDLIFTQKVRKRERENRLTAEKVIDFLHLESYRNQMVDHLPYGARKLIELGRALCMSPQLLLLDEPCSGLNPEERRDMVFWIRDIRDLLDITVVLIEHDMGVISKVCDRVLALNNGELLAIGKPASVQANSRVAEAYLGKIPDRVSLLEES